MPERKTRLTKDVEIVDGLWLITLGNLLYGLEEDIDHDDPPKEDIVSRFKDICEHFARDYIEC